VWLVVILVADWLQLSLLLPELHASPVSVDRKPDDGFPSLYVGRMIRSIAPRYNHCMFRLPFVRSSNNSAMD
jgi:hypothetical protein